MKPLPAICRVIVLARRFFWRPALLRRSTRPAQFTTTSAHQRAKTTSFSQRLKGATVFQICAALGYFASQHWLRKQRVKLSAKNEIAKAITYSLNQWRGLVRFLDDGRLCMSNNAAERALRCVAVRASTER
jgi:hypothetical protein